MIKTTIIFLLVSLSTAAVAQTGQRFVAERQVMLLKNGTLVVRLKTNDKSIEAYRKAGKEKLAKKMELDNRLMNLYLMQSFLYNFDFCKLIFIKAKDTRKLLNHEPGIFLNEELNSDPSITFKGDSFFVAEYGATVSNMKNNSYNYNEGTIQESQNPASNSALVIMDTSLRQLQDPFPYYSIVNINFSNFSKKHPIKNPKKVDDKRTPFDAAVKTLNEHLIKFYIEACSKKGLTVTEDRKWWEDNNPNKNTDARVLEMRIEENTVIDEKKHLK